jgi:hypothetical protein
MALLTNTVPTLSDVLTRMGPTGDILAIGELLNQLNPILEDAVWMEGNLPTGHVGSVRTGLPSVSFRRRNAGVTPSKSTTQLLEVGCGEIAGLSKVDVKNAEMGGNVGAFRASESVAFIEAMSQFLSNNLIYGNVGTTPEGFTGFKPLYDKISGGSTAQNIIDCSGSSTDNSSIYLVGWGHNTATMIYPKGSTAGLKHEDKGKILVPDDTGIGGAMLEAYVDKYEWNCGLYVADWRYIVRAANIDISNLVGESSAADLIKTMIKMIHRIPSLAMCRPVFYVSRSVREMLDIQALAKASSQLTLETFSGKRVTAFQGIPIRTVDKISESEARVT